MGFRPELQGRPGERAASTAGQDGSVCLHHPSSCRIVEILGYLQISPQLYTLSTMDDQPNPMRNPEPFLSTPILTVRSGCSEQLVTIDRATLNLADVLSQRRLGNASAGPRPGWDRKPDGDFPRPTAQQCTILDAPATRRPGSPVFGRWGARRSHPRRSRHHRREQRERFRDSAYPYVLRPVSDGAQ